MVFPVKFFAFILIKVFLKYLIIFKLAQIIKCIDKNIVIISINQPNIFSFCSKFKPMSDNLVGRTFVNPINNEIPAKIKTLDFIFIVSSDSIF
jgi:hypothetical protein